MGSSPVTATIPAGAPRRRLLACLDRELAAVPVAPGELLLVAFSGGPDSTALLLGLVELAPHRGWRLLAGHVDHRLDPGSAARAAAAAGLASRLGVEQVTLVPDGPGKGAARGRDQGRGPEAAARQLRYGLLERLRQQCGAPWLLTAHHGDDQAETVLLRLLGGTGLAGLAAMRSRRHRLLRPLLPLGRSELAAAVASAGLAALRDPTNDDLAVPRNLLRKTLLPAGGPRLRAACLAVAGAAAGARAAIERRLAGLAPIVADAAGARLELAALRRLPPELVPWALGALHREVGLPYPPRRAAVAELRRQLAGSGEVGCDCAAGWCWHTAGGWLHLRPAPAADAAPAPFAYTLGVPGRVEIREAATTFHLTRQPADSWRLLEEGRSRERVVLDLPLTPGDTVTVRSRRAGDRLQPLGRARRRSLKDLLIDRRVPRGQRDGLPLLCVGGQVAWVPGVTLHAPFQLRQDSEWAWVAELGPLAQEER